MSARILIISTVAIGILSFAAPVFAQDWLRLHSNKTIRGECLEDGEKSVKIIDGNAVIHVVDKADIKRLKIRPLKKPVAAKLAAIDANDPAAMLEVAEWAAGNKKLAKDSLRIALRILALDQSHAAAREMLGHVQILAVWYRDSKSAQKALAEKLTADGFVKVEGGWIKADQEALYKVNPEAWMLVENVYWRLIDDVMKERGFKKFEGEWYAKKDHDLVKHLEYIKSEFDEVLHAAREGSISVFSVLGRESAQEHLENLSKARAWFVETFCVSEKSKELLVKPHCRKYILTDVSSLDQFAGVFAKKYKISGDAAAFALSAGHLTWVGLGHATSLRHPLWTPLLISQIGGDMLNYAWKGDIDVPPWLWVACAHSAEFNIFDQARVQYIGQDPYGRKTDPPKLKGRKFRDIKSDLRDHYRAKEVPALQVLFIRSFNELNGPMNIMGIVLMRYLLEKHKEQLLAFIGGKPAGPMKQRFKHYFKTSFTAMDHEFRTWVMDKKTDPKN
ncbi:MAG: hypothetical protein V3W41_10870 [Planctomycetota bacterium]